MNKKIISALFLIAVAHSVISVNINKRQVANIDDIIASLENENNANINSAVNTPKPTQSTISLALQQLSSAFQQYISAYITLLSGLTRRLGIGETNYLESPIVIKQIEENIEQFRETVREFGKQISGLLTRDGPTNGNVALDQLNKFINLWQKQIRDVTDQITRSFGGLTSEEEVLPQLKQEQPSNPINQIQSILFPAPLMELIQQFVRLFQTTIQQFTEQIRRLFPTERVLDQSEQLSALRQVRNTLQHFQQQFETLTESFAKALNLSVSYNQESGVQLPQVIGLQQFQQILEAFQRQLASLVNTFSRVITVG